MATLLGKILADFTTALSTDIAVGGTTATLSSATDDDGVALPSGRYFFTIDGSNSSKEHISCDLVGTALTNIKSLSRQGVETTGVARKHRIGASVSLTDFGHIKFINDLVSGATNLNSAAPLGYDGAPASLTGNQLATVTYVLGVVNGGAVTFDQQVLSNMWSGETVTVNDIVFFKESDAFWYKADADLTATFDQLQLGISKTTTVGSASMQVAISGPVSGFTGLSVGDKYYLSNTSGAITTTPGTNSVFIGWALSTTILLFNPLYKTMPTQKEKDALVGSTGTPSSTNKYVTQDNTSESTTDQTQSTQNSSTEVGEADATTKKNKLAQSFIPTKTKIRGVNLYKSADTGTFTGTVTVSLQADSSGSPSGSALATQTITNASWISKSVGEIEVLFSSEYASLTVGSLYWIVIETSTSDNSNHPNIGTNTAGGYTNGSVKFKNTTDNWTAIATIDLYFKTLEGNNSQLVKTNASGKIDSDFIPSEALGELSVGSLSSSFIKTYFNTIIPFLMYTGDSSGGTTGVSNWVPSGSIGTDIIINPGGASLSLVDSGVAGLSLASIFNITPGVTLRWDNTNKIIMDWWGYLPTTSTGDINMGLSSAILSGIYTNTERSIRFSQTSAGVLYAATADGTNVTTYNLDIGHTPNMWNNYRIEFEPGVSAKFYINGVHQVTINTTLPSNSSSIGISFGRSGTASFTVSAPTVSIEMNP